jgi:5-methylcytosine-specific restriction protein B
MARQMIKRDITPVLATAQQWIQACLIEDRSVFSAEPRWTASLVTEVFKAFVEHPDVGDDDFMTKLKGQMKEASPPAQTVNGRNALGTLAFPIEYEGAHEATASA